MDKKFNLSSLNSEFIDRIEGSILDYPDTRVLVSVVSSIDRSVRSFWPAMSMRDVARSCVGIVHGLDDSDFDRVAGDLVYFHGTLNVSDLAINLEDPAVCVGTVGAIAGHYLSTVKE